MALTCFCQNAQHFLHENSWRQGRRSVTCASPTPLRLKKCSRASRSAMVALLLARWCRPVLTAVGGCHLSRNQGLPDPTDARTTLASIEVLAVDAARRDGRHVCQSSSRPLYGFAGAMHPLHNGQNPVPQATMESSDLTQ